jgi:uncharacterized protein
MPRPRLINKIQMPPRVKGFNPVGIYRMQAEPIKLNIEEYEAIRLLDYEGLTQVEAALMMGISRPSLTRIYERARKKMATMITEARQLLIEGGKVVFDSEWYSCERCDCKFNNPDKLAHNQCLLCGSNNIFNMED